MPRRIPHRSPARAPARRSQRADRIETSRVHHSSMGPSNRASRNLPMGPGLPLPHPTSGIRLQRPFSLESPYFVTGIGASRNATARVLRPHGRKALKEFLHMVATLGNRYERRNAGLGDEPERQTRDDPIEVLGRVRLYHEPQGNASSNGPA